MFLLLRNFRWVWRTLWATRPWRAARRPAWTRWWRSLDAWENLTRTNQCAPRKSKPFKSVTAVSRWNTANPNPWGTQYNITMTFLCNTESILFAENLVILLLVPMPRWLAGRWLNTWGSSLKVTELDKPTPSLITRITKIEKCSNVATGNT